MEPLSLTGLWGQRLLLLGLSALGLLLGLAPMGLQPRDLPSPDLVYAVLTAWTIRRPEAVPLLSVFLIGLTADLLRGAPLGIGTLCLIGITELLRRTGDGLRRGPFLMEWLTVAALFLAMLAAQCFAMWLTFVSRPGLGLLLLHALGTIIGYPFTVLALGTVLRLRRRGPERSLL